MILPIIIGEFGDDGTPRCEQCGAFILRPGLCAVCAESVGEVLVPVDISPRVMLNPEDLLEN